MPPESPVRRPEDLAGVPIGFLVTGSDVSKGDVDKYLSARRRAQLEIGLHPERPPVLGGYDEVAPI